jgi:hypothetical protein
MVIVTGPPQNGWWVEVGAGPVVDSWFKSTAWVEVITRLEAANSSGGPDDIAEIEGAELLAGVYVGKSRLGPRGLFHLDNIYIPEAATPSTKIKSITKITLCFCMVYLSSSILLYFPVVIVQLTVL